MKIIKIDILSPSSLRESRMHLIDARTVREQGVSSNPGPRVSEITKG